MEDCIRSKWFTNQLAKVEHMRCVIERDNEKPVKLDGIELKSVQPFKYFG